MNRKTLSLLGIFSVSMLAGCGKDNSGNAVRMTFDGNKTIEFRSTDAFCDAAAGFTDFPGSGGIVTAPILCKNVFHVPNQFQYQSFVAISVDSISDIVLGEFYSLGYGVDATVVCSDCPSAGGNELWLDGGVVSFYRVSNVVGGLVCAEYELSANLGIVFGRFCARIRDGF